MEEILEISENVPSDVIDLSSVLPHLEQIIEHLTQIEIAIGFLFGAVLVLLFGGVLRD